MDRQQLLAASHEEVRQLSGQGVSEVTPSRRDFAMFVTTQRQDPAIIAHLATQPGRPWATQELVAHARACDEADVAALAIAAGTVGLSMAELAAVADATTAPILRDHPLIHPSQLHHSRLHGADAVLLPALGLEHSALRELVATATSLHMACVIEVGSAAEVATALRLPHVIVGVRCQLADGSMDIVQTRQLAEQVPRQYTLIALAEIDSPTEYAALQGMCDAVVVGAALRRGPDVGTALRAITQG